MNAKDQRIAELEASEEMLMSQCVEWRDKAQKSDQRIAELETWVRDVVDTIEDSRHRKRGQALLEKGNMERTKQNDNDKNRKKQLGNLR